MSRIVKSGSVRLDNSNTYVIETQRIETVPVSEEEPEYEEEKLNDEEKIINKARREAERIIKLANFDAEMLMQDVRTQAEESRKTIEKDAWNEAYQKGYQEGLEKAENTIKEAKNQLEEARLFKENTINSLEQELVELIINIVDKLLCAGIKINPQIITALVRQGMTETTITGEVNIRVSPIDFGNVVAARSEFLSLISGNGNIEIIKDATLEQGDCLIETAFGNVDVSLGRQYDDLRKDLMLLFETGE